jgi:hypothetical protein
MGFDCSGEEFSTVEHTKPFTIEGGYCPAGNKKMK